MFVHFTYEIIFFRGFDFAGQGAFFKGSLKRFSLIFQINDFQDAWFYNSTIVTKTLKEV